MSPAEQRQASIETGNFAYPAQQGRTAEYRAEWIESPALVMDERGMIHHCNKSGESLFGYRSHELVWQHVSILLPQLSGVALVRDGRLNPLLNYICHCGHLFQSKKSQGENFLCELSFIQLDYDDRRSLRLIVRPSGNSQA